MIEELTKSFYINCALDEEKKLRSLLFEKNQLERRIKRTKENIEFLKNQENNEKRGTIYVKCLNGAWKKTEDQKRSKSFLYAFKHIRFVRKILGGMWEKHSEIWYAVNRKSGWKRETMFSPTIAPEVYYETENWDLIQEDQEIESFEQYELRRLKDQEPLYKVLIQDIEKNAYMGSIKMPGGRFPQPGEDFTIDVFDCQKISRSFATSEDCDDFLVQLSKSVEGIIFEDCVPKRKIKVITTILLREEEEKRKKNEILQ